MSFPYLFNLNRLPMEKEWNANDWMDGLQPHWQEWLANVFGVQSRGTFIHLIKDRFTLSQEQADAIYLHLSTIKPENHG